VDQGAVDKLEALSQSRMSSVAKLATAAHPDTTPLSRRRYNSVAMR
jgi:hypothetical protein